MYVNISLDEPTYNRFMELSHCFHGTASTIAAGLVRAALRYGLRPEAPLIPSGRPATSQDAVVKRKLVRRPMTRAGLVATFAHRQIHLFDPGAILDSLVARGEVVLDHNNLHQVAPKLIPFVDDYGKPMRPITT